MMNPAWPKTALADLKAPTFAENNIVFGYSNVFELYMHVTVGRVIFAKDVHRPQYGDAFGIDRDQNLRLS